MKNKQLIEFFKKAYMDDEKSFKSVNTSITFSEKKFEKELEAFIALFFSTFSTNDVIDYSTARRYIDRETLQSLKSLSDDKKWAKPKYREFLNSILKKVRVSRIEYMQANCISKFEYMITNVYDKIMSNFIENTRTNILEDVEFLSEGDLGITDEQLNSLSKEIANMKTPYGSPRMQVEAIRNSYYQFIDTFIPQAFARKLTKEQILNEIRKNSVKIKNRLHTLVKSMGNYQFNYVLKYVMNQLGIDSYEFCAILDDVTSTICKELNGQTFKVSQAQVGVNYPPMHPNCRSFVIPII